MTRTIVLAGVFVAALAMAFSLAAGMHESHEKKSGQQGNVQLTITITAPADQAAEGDRIFKNHAVWMAETHHREGDKALLRYNVSKAAELSNPMDPSSEPTGSTNFVLMEVYETDAGVADHFQQASESWSEYESFLTWLGNCDVKMVASAPIVHSLW